MDPDLAAKYPEWHKELIKMKYGLRFLPTSSFEHVFDIIGWGIDLVSEECGWMQGFDHTWSSMNGNWETFGLRMALVVEYLYGASNGHFDLWPVMTVRPFCKKNIPAVIRLRGFFYDIIELTDSRLEYVPRNADGAVALLLEYDRTKLDKFACLSEASDMCQMLGLHASNLPLTDPIMVYHDLRSSS